MSDAQVTRALCAATVLIGIVSLALAILLPLSALAAMAYLVGAALVLRIGAEVFVCVHRVRNAAPRC